jgi:hypothetical protein
MAMTLVWFGRDGDGGNYQCCGWRLFSAIVMAMAEKMGVAGGRHTRQGIYNIAKTRQDQYFQYCNIQVIIAMFIYQDWGRQTGKMYSVLQYSPLILQYSGAGKHYLKLKQIYKFLLKIVKQTCVQNFLAGLFP